MTAEPAPDPTYAGLSLQDVDGFLDPVIEASGRSGAWKSDPQTVRALAHCCLYLRRACGDLADRVRVLEGLVARLGPPLGPQLGPRHGPAADTPCEPPLAGG